MKNVPRLTLGTLVLAACWAIAPLMYARGGRGGGRGGHGNGHAAAHATRGHAGFGVRGVHGHRFVGHARGNARFAGRAFQATRGGWGRGGGWGGSYWYPYYGYSGFGYYGLGYSYPYYGYYPWGYYPYRYGYWPYWGLSF